MAIAYKGFKLYGVQYNTETASYDIIEDFGNVEYCFTEHMAYPQTGSFTSIENAINSIERETTERLNITCTVAGTLTETGLSAIRALIPKTNDIVMSHVSRTFMLRAANGSYAIIGNTWDLFNSNNEIVAQINGVSLSATINCLCGYFSIANFDGTVPSNGTLYITRIYLPNERPVTYNIQIATNSLTQAIANWFNNIGPLPPEDTDPYSPGGNSDTGGGTGSFDLTSDQIDVSNLPTLSAVDTGLVTLYTPTLTQLQALARYLWNADAITIDWWKKLIANPLDLILGLSIVPVTVPQGATENVYVGLIDTGITMTKAASQYVQVDCGSLNITEFYGAALDYLPFRKTSIYLPFVGTRTISTDDIMGKTVQVVYNIDLLSGALTAMVKCGDAVLYQYSGACNIAIPLSGQSFTDLALSTLQLAAGVGATVASGGSAAGIVAANAANSVMSMKPTIERAGGVSGAAGQLAIMRPYLIGEIPRQSVPKNYNKFAGYPSNVSALLGDLEGYTEVETIYLEGITATSDELDEIENLLKAGVYI